MSAILNTTQQECIQRVNHLFTKITHLQTNLTNQISISQTQLQQNSTLQTKLYESELRETKHHTELQSLSSNLKDEVSNHNKTRTELSTLKTLLPEKQTSLENAHLNISSLTQKLKTTELELSTQREKTSLYQKNNALLKSQSDRHQSETIYYENLNATTNQTVDALQNASDKKKTKL